MYTIATSLEVSMPQFFCKLAGFTILNISVSTKDAKEKLCINLLENVWSIKDNKKFCGLLYVLVIQSSISVYMYGMEKAKDFHV